MPTESRLEFDSVEEAIEEIRQGRIVIVVDDEDRENEGDLIMAASFVKPEDINFMAKFGRGLICVPMEEERLKLLDLQPMYSENGVPRAADPFPLPGCYRSRVASSSPSRHLQ
jgi:3,4-dihydroxy 2-butanone 4-phosphate synthase/GTP cyclohydrolase II